MESEGLSSLQKKRQFWTDEEDARLVQLVAIHGMHNWPDVAVGLRGRDGKSCSLRWRYFLAPHIIRSTDDKLSHWEVAVLFWGLKHYGNKWRTIVDNYLPWRSPSDLKNYANQYLHAKLPQVVRDNSYLSQGYSLQDLLASQPQDIAARWQRVKSMQEAGPAAAPQAPKKGTRALSYIFRQAAKQQSQRAAWPYSKPLPPAAMRTSRQQPAASTPPASFAAASAAAAAIKGGLLSAQAGGAFDAPAATPAAAAAASSGPSAGSNPPLFSASILAAVQAALARAPGAAAAAAAAAAGGAGRSTSLMPPTTPWQQRQQQQPLQQQGGSVMLPQGMPASTALPVLSTAGMPTQLLLPNGAFNESSSGSSNSSGLHLFFTSPRNSGGSSCQPLAAGQLSGSSGCFVQPTALQAAHPAAAYAPPPAAGCFAGSTGSFSSSSSALSTATAPGSPASADDGGWSSQPVGLVNEGMLMRDAGSFVCAHGGSLAHTLGSFGSLNSSVTAACCDSPHKQLPPGEILAQHLQQQQQWQQQQQQLQAQSAGLMLPPPVLMHHQQQQVAGWNCQQDQPFQQLLLSEDWQPAATEEDQQHQGQLHEGQQQHQQAPASFQAAPAAASTHGGMLPASPPAPQAAPEFKDGDLAAILFGRRTSTDDDAALHDAAADAAAAAFGSGGGAGFNPVLCSPRHGAADGFDVDLDDDEDFDLSLHDDAWLQLPLPSGQPAAGAACKQQELLAGTTSVSALLDQMDSAEVFRHLPGW